MEGNFASAPLQDQNLSYELTDRERFKRQLRIELENSSFKQFGIADDLGVDSSLISHWKEEDTGKNCMPAHWLMRWTRVAGPGLLRWVARQGGYDLVPRDSSAPGLHATVEQLLGGFSTDAGAALGQVINGKADLALWLKIQHLVNSIVDLYQRAAGRPS